MQSTGGLTSRLVDCDRFWSGFSNRVLTKGIDGGDWLDVLWMDRIVLRDY